MFWYAFLFVANLIALAVNFGFWITLGDPWSMFAIGFGAASQLTLLWPLFE